MNHLNTAAPSIVAPHARRAALFLILALCAFAAPAAHSQEGGAATVDGGRVSVVVRLLDLSKADLDGAGARRAARSRAAHLTDAAGIYDGAYFEKRLRRLLGRGRAGLVRSLSALVESGERLHLSTGASYPAFNSKAGAARRPSSTPNIINEESSVELLVRPDRQAGDYEVIFEAVRITIATTPSLSSPHPPQAIKHSTGRNFFLRGGDVALLRDRSTVRPAGRGRARSARYFAITLAPAGARQPPTPRAAGAFSGR